MGYSKITMYFQFYSYRLVPLAYGRFIFTLLSSKKGTLRRGGQILLYNQEQ